MGLELGEFPYLGQGHDYPLEEGMAFALVPKIVFPAEGSVAIENTVVVTGEGCGVLTSLDEGTYQVSSWTELS